MPRQILIAGNWKMNKTIAAAQALLADLRTRTAEMEGVEVVVCPPFTTLAAAVQTLRGTPIGVGAQNVHWEDAGAFTGEVSAPMLKELAVDYVIIGHSERRQYFGETDETVNQRLKAALAADLKPIVCIGETLTQRETGETRRVVRTQLEGALAGIPARDVERTVLAYEPIWAIGTGRTATPDQAQEVHGFLRSVLRSHWGDVADNTRILYGGSMKPGNASDLLRLPDIDGGLIGGASLEAEDFLGIVTAA